MVRETTKKILNAYKEKLHDAELDMAKDDLSIVEHVHRSKMVQFFRDGVCRLTLLLDSENKIS